MQVGGVAVAKALVSVLVLYWCYLGGDYSGTAMGALVVVRL